MPTTKIYCYEPQVPVDDTHEKKSPFEHLFLRIFQKNKENNINKMSQIYISSYSRKREYQLI